jgi:hypothetical protein
MTLARVVFCVSVLCVAASCGPKRIPKPPAAEPSLVDESDAIPGDLDVALRIDLSKIRSALGEAEFELLRRGTPVGGATGDAGSESLLADAIAKADSVVVAFRPSADAKATDSVLVLRGRFTGIDPRRYETEPRWGPPMDLGADWRRWDRAPPKGRAAPARIYARSNDLFVFVSTAPIDSVERQLELAADDPHVEPVDKGLISVDARSAAFLPFVEKRAPSFANLIAQSTRLRMFVDLDSVSMTGELELELDSEAVAKEAAEAVGNVAKDAQSEGGLAGDIASGLRIQAVGDRLVLRISLPAGTVKRLLVCAGGGPCD